MLKKSNKTYLFLSVIIFLILFPFLEYSFFPFYVFSIINFIAFFGVINSSLNFKTSYQNLGLTVIIFSLLIVAVLNSISFLYEGNFFVLSFADAKMYDSMSKQMAWMDFKESISFYLDFWSIEDLGAVLLTSTTYRIIESNLTFNVFNIVTGVISAFGLFRIGKHIMPERYSFVCALSFTLSSYFIWFHASGLKESFMIMVVILFFDQFYMYLQNQKPIHVILSAIFVLMLVLFRSVIMFFCILSISMMFFLKNSSLKKNLLILGLSIIVFVIFFPFLKSTVTHFLRGGDLAMMIAHKESEGMIKGGIVFTYAVNFLSQTVGPLPTFLPSHDPKLSFYSVGLLYRMVLAFPFWIGSYYIFKKSQRELYPLLFFIFMEMVSLIFILEGIELRKSVLHLPFVYLVAFWFMGSEYGKHFFRKQLNRFAFFAHNSTVLLITVGWNFR